MNGIYNINRGQDQSPQEVFNNICNSPEELPVAVKVLATGGWTNIAVKILRRKNELPYYSSGVTLAAFAVNYICKIESVKLSRTVLEQGTECLRYLTDKVIEAARNSTDVLKEQEKIWWKTFLDIWKEYMKKCLEQDNKLTDF